MKKKDIIKIEQVEKKNKFSELTPFQKIIVFLQKMGYGKINN